MNGRSDEEGHPHFTSWVMSHRTQKQSSWRAGPSALVTILFILNLELSLAHDSHEVINGINLNNASLWEYKTVLLSRYFHTH